MRNTCCIRCFFPFVDGIEKLVQAGVTGIIQPYGSIRDKEIIDFANKTKTVLVFQKQDISTISQFYQFLQPI